MSAALSLAAAGLALTVTASLLPATAQPIQRTSWHIDVGGKGYVDKHGTRWVRDTGWIGGRQSGSQRVIRGSADPSLYGSIRVGMKGYTLPLRNGTYRVTLKMAETYWSSKGKRIFSATVEGVPVFSHLDLIAVAGRGRPVDRSIVVRVTDGRLDLRFQRIVDLPTLSAIDVVPTAAPARTAAAVPTRPATTTVTKPATTTVTTTTSTSAGTTAPVTSTKASGRLSWAPPALHSPVDVYLTSSNLHITLPSSQDARLILPSTTLTVPSPTTGVTISGGHNLVMIGGAVADPGNHYPAVKFKNTTGDIHIEGVHLVGPNLGEGFQFQDVSGTVTMENVRIDDLNTVNPICGVSTYHCDGFQTYFTGPKQVRIDHLTGSTTYQFFMLQDSSNGSWDLRNVNIEHHAGPAGETGWTMFDAGPKASSIRWSNVYLYDRSVAPSQMKGVYSLGRGGTLPGLFLSPPPGGDFVPAGVAGPRYVSPGYA